MLVSLFTVAALAIGALGAPTEVRHVLHEKRSAPPAGWAPHHRLDPDKILPMRIALTQSNLDKLHDNLMEVSHPESDKFGKHWTAKEVAEMYAPSSETVETVTEWLKSAGIDTDKIEQTQSLGWLNVKVTVAEAEELLKTRYFSYEHTSSGTPHVACTEYHVPEHVSKHVDFITPTIHFDAKILPPAGGDEALERRDKPGAGTAIGKPGSSWLPKQGRVINMTPDLAGAATDNCNTMITPACLRALYAIPSVTKSSVTTPYGIVEYTPQEYVQSDLNTFFAQFSPSQVQKTPTLVSIDGGPAQTTDRSFNINGESNLDLEYAMALVNPIPVTLYQVGDAIESGSFNTFLDALDASYCQQNDPTQDPSYPDPATGGYKGPLKCGGVAAAKVISTSYGYNEVDLSAAYETRQCNEYAKFGQMGTSFLFSSGDNGVAGNGGQCLNADGSLNSGGSGKFAPSFPSTCPYITSVGATQIPSGGSVTTPEVAAFSVIKSGGGFSNNFALPSYQSAAVASYYKNHPPPYTSSRYNNNQKARGYPDVSANGANYVVIIDGTSQLVYGTSASSPTFGAIVAIINENRAQAGKGPAGFLNPTLYANPTAFHDIVSGNNPGCGTNGFSAVSGWDPVTGLGTPNTPALINVFKTLA